VPVGSTVGAVTDTGGEPVLFKSPLLAPLVLGLTLVGLIVAPMVAAAPTIAITVGPDPAESIATQLGVTGSAMEGNSQASLKVKPAGGRACGANNSADDGATVIEPYQLYLANPGPYSGAHNWTFSSAGSYLLCAWLESSGSSAVATASLTVVIRPPHLTLSIQAPPAVTPGRTFQVAMTVQAETEREAYEFVIPDNGRGCPANAAAAESTAGKLGIRPYGVIFDGGPTTVTDNESLTTLGAYLVCAYIEYPGSASVPEAMASASLLVARPRPPCVVPRVGVNQGLAAVERRIKSAHCTVGALRYTHSSRYRRGVVIGLSPRPGTKLAPRAAVGVVMSSGPRRRHHRRRH
jgi:hypothetical protein